jgi:lysophospholipase L1-like esterase
MGDSITFGQYIDPSLRWTAIVEGELRRWLPGIDVRTHNRGISGETTRQGLERFPRDVQEAAPDLMTLQFGLNDCNCWETDKGLPRVSPAAFRANLVEMIDRGRNFGAREIVMATNHRTMKDHRLPSGEVYEDANRRYSEIIREVAAECGTDLCDIRAAFEGLAEAELATMLLPAPDLLHLSPRGNQVYASAILPHVVKAVESAALQVA